MPTDPTRVVPVVQPHDEDYRRAIEEVQDHMSKMLVAGHGREVTLPASPTSTAIEVLTHLVGGLVADGYRYQRRLDELEKRSP